MHGKKKNSLDKIVKVFTSPKPKDLLLSDLEWITVTNSIRMTTHKHPILKDRVFYHISYGRLDLYFCNKNTWENYSSGDFTHSVDKKYQNQFLALYKVLTMQYYEETIGE